MEIPNSGLKTIRKQDLFCLFLYYLQYSRIRNQIFRWRKTPVVRILAFHDVGRAQVESFREKLEIVKRIGNVVSLDDIAESRLSSNKINVAITFDDGFTGWLENASPLLNEFGMNATFFVSSGLVGLEGERERQFLANNLMSNRQMSGSLISADSLRKLVERGFDIGGHTCNHVNLAEIRDPVLLHSEIEKDKIELESITGARVKYFAYPFGVCTNKYFNLTEILRGIGYKGALTLVPGFITPETSRYFWHRDLANPSMSSKVFEARLLGNYDGVVGVRRTLGLS